MGWDLVTPDGLRITRRRALGEFVDPQRIHEVLCRVSQTTAGDGPMTVVGRLSGGRIVRARMRNPDQFAPVGDGTYTHPAARRGDRFTEADIQAMRWFMGAPCGRWEQVRRDDE